MPNGKGSTDHDLSNQNSIHYINVMSYDTFAKYCGKH